MDKAIICNRAAMEAKYGAAWTANIYNALQRMVAADGQRNLNTKTIDIDNSAQISAFGGQPVVNAADERGAKQAVDAVWNAAKPDYIMLLDGPDVIPHITLRKIVGLADPDNNIPSDLPYASSAPFGRLAANFLSITRVVGRLPATEGATQPAGLVRMIDAAAAHVPQPAGSTTPYFAISAQVWQQSTQLSLSNIFGNSGSLSLSPTAGHPRINQALGRLAHFVNCHGGTADSHFYGQAGSAYPVAMESSKLAGKISPGTVAAAECCYGAELYNANLAALPEPICTTYLHEGAIAFLGSTNVAYGPASGNGQADFLTQYFLEDMLAGASSGRALLQARQRFAQGQKMANPTNLKTLAQFLLLGDPSLVGWQAMPALAEDDAIDENDQRMARRKTLFNEGSAIAEAATKAVAVDETPPDISGKLIAMAEEKGFSADSMTVLGVTGGAAYKAASKQFDRPEHIVTFIDVGDSTETPFPAVRVFVAHMLGDSIVRVEETLRR
jgi:Peptidase family C25